MIVRTYLLGLILLLTPKLMAQVPVTTTHRPVEVPSGMPDKNWSLGINSGFVHYSEPGLMQEYGNLFGINASYSKTTDDRSVFGRVEYEGLFGTLTYDGGNKHGPVSMPSHDSLHSLRGVTGLNWALNDVVRFAPYTGLGGRYLDDIIDGPGGYERQISYLYLPIGMETHLGVIDSWKLTLKTEADIFLAGTAHTTLSDVNPDLPDLDNSQNSGFGWRASLSSMHKINQIVVKLEPYIQSWNINQSKVDRGFIEPDNNSTLIGLVAAVEF